jgi:hypothetical protein
LPCLSRHLHRQRPAGIKPFDIVTQFVHG